MHLMEIRRYHMKGTYDLWRDGHCIYEGTKQILETEEKKMNNWLIARTLVAIYTHRDKLSPVLQAWWKGFWGDGSDRTEETFAFTQDNYDRVCLALENLRYYYRENGQTCPEELTVDRCKQALDIFSNSLRGAAEAIAALEAQWMEGNLNAILDYEDGNDALDALKTALRRRLQQLRECMSTDESMRVWAANVAEDLKEFTEKVGHAHYEGGDPYGGGRPELVQNPENIMIAYVERQIQACIKNAGKIRGKRQREDMAKRTAYKEGPPAHVPTREDAPESVGFFKSYLEKIRADNVMPAPPAYVPTPADPSRARDYPRNSPHHPSQTYAETERLVRAFVAPVEALWTYVEGSGPQPMGWRDADEVVARVREAHALIVDVKRCLVGVRLRPTTEEVRAILQKLEEVAGAKARVRNHRNESPLTMKLMACGPPCQKYVAYTDVEQSQSLPWQNGLMRLQTAEERRGH